MEHDESDLRAAFVAGFRAARNQGVYHQPLAPISESTADELFERYYEIEYGDRE